MPNVLLVVRRRPLWFWTALLLFVLAAGCWLVLSGSQARPPHPFFLRSPDRPLIIAYRGASAEAPENTLPAFRQAIREGSDALALDIRMTHDREWVVTADPVLETTSDGHGAVSDAFLEDVKALDAAYRFTTDEGRTFPYRGHGVTVPTLEEVFEAFPGVRMVLQVHELRPGDATSLERLIRKWERWDQVALVVREPEAYKELVSALPDVAASAGPAEAKRFFVLHRLGLLPFVRRWSDVLIVPVPASDPDPFGAALVGNAHRRRLQVLRGPVDDGQAFGRAARDRVDGILTRRPRELRAILDNPDHGAVTQLDDPAAGVGDLGVVRDDD